MVPLYQDACFTFRFNENRIIPRFHLEGVKSGQPVTVYSVNPESGQRIELIATAAVGEDGWVDLAEPIVVKAGEMFVVEPEGL